MASGSDITPCIKIVKTLSGNILSELHTRQAALSTQRKMELEMPNGVGSSKIILDIDRESHDLNIDFLSFDNGFKQI